MRPCRRSSSPGRRGRRSAHQTGPAAGLGEAEERRDARLRPVAVGVLERGHPVDLEVARPGAVGVQHLPRPARVDLDDVAVALEEVDHRRGEELQVAAGGGRRAPAPAGAAGRRARSPPAQRATTGRRPSTRAKWKRSGIMKYSRSSR